MTAFVVSNIAAALKQIGRAQLAISKARDPAYLRDGAPLLTAKWALQEAAIDLENALTLEKMTTKEGAER